MIRNKLYLLLSGACLAGFAWLSVAFINSTSQQMNVCMFKNVTGIPCPSCGSTRAVLSLMHGDLAASLLKNPLGIFLLSAMIIIPFWVLYDLLRKKDSLFIFYHKTENIIRQKYVAIPLILLVLGNWIWNICKGL